MNLPDKLRMYQQLANVPPAQLSGWLGVPEEKLNQLDSLDLGTDVLSRLSAATGVSIEVWQNDNKALPDPLPRRSGKPGRPAKVLTTDARLGQQRRRERLRQVIKDRYEDIDQEFAKAVEISVSSLSHYLKSRTLTDAFLLKVSKFTGISANWLLHGEGPMVGSTDIEATDDANDEGSMLNIYLRNRDISNRALGLLMNLSPNTASKTVSQYINSKQLRHSTKSKIAKALEVREEAIFYQPITSRSLRSIDKVYEDDNSEWVYLPFIPVKARATFDYERFWDEPEEYGKYPVRVSVLKPDYIKRRGVVIEVDGDSMEPELRSGHKLTAYEIDPGDWPFTSGVVAVRFRNEFVIKRIRENRLRETGHLTLTSDNPSGGTFSIPASEIQVMWKLDEFVGGKVR